MAKQEWETYERKYCIDHDNKTFTKTEIPFNTNMYGERTTAWMSKERIRNEYLALKLIKETTTIPVPEPLGLTERNGCLSVTTEYMPGVVGLDDLPESLRPAAAAKADQFIKDVVLPQLARLRSDRNGALTGDIIPPRRVEERFRGARWKPIARPRSTSTTTTTTTTNAPKIEPAGFTFCHNDLGQHNLLCHPETGDVLYIIDWEYAGYYDPSFEGAIWLKPYHEVDVVEEELVDLASRLGHSVINLRSTPTTNL